MHLLHATVLFAIVLGIMVLVHELGHFLMGKLCGVRVDTFSIGFGPRLLGVKYGETDYRISALPLGSTAEIGILHQGQKSTLSVPMIAPPEDPPRHETQIEGRNPVSGAKIANLSPALAEQLSLPPTTLGIVVTSVKDNTIAANVGLQPGDILTSINGKKITGVEEARTALQSPPALGWRLTIRRGDSEITLMLGG